VPEALLAQANRFVLVLLSVGMAGVGLKTNLRDLKRAGWLPVSLGLAQMAFLAALALGLAAVLRI
jgi:uncharacterized membrane protein YadS